jgi:hypothetical protein
VIRLRRLRLSGPTNTYEVDFDARESNLAIIAGQILTGKSTILGFLDYCLGGHGHPTHPEVARKVRSVALELDIDAVTWTIERPVFSNEQLAWVHAGGLNRTAAPTTRKNLEAPSVPDSLSAWLIQSAGLEGLRLKVTPGNPNSPTNLMSFRDLMWLCYLPNRRLDNQELLFESDRIKQYKLQQVVEVLFDVADQRLTDLVDQLGRLRTEHRDQVAEIKSLESFLLESHTPPQSEIDARRAEIAGQRAAIVERLAGIEGQMAQATSYAQELRAQFGAARERSLAGAKQLRDRRALVERLLPLRGQYAEDERKLTFVGEARRLFDPLHVLACPSCLQNLPEAPRIEDSRCTLCGQELLEDPDAGFDVEAERRATRERMGHLDRYIDEVQDEVRLATATVAETRFAEQRIEVELDSRVASDLSPFVHDREILIRGREQLHAQDAALDQALALHEGLERRKADLAKLEARQQAVGRELDERRKNRPEKEQVVADLSEHFADLLRVWGFPKVDEDGAPRLDDDFVPWVHGRPYREVGSSGALTLIAVAWQLTLFERAIEEGLPHPGFLIIDSPQKNLSPDAVGDTDFLDPKIVESMWSHMARWCENHPHAQLIVVDNTPPALVGDHVIVRFSRDTALPPYGLISDETG